MPIMMMMMMMIMIMMTVAMMLTRRVMMTINTEQDQNDQCTAVVNDYVDC